LPSVPIPTHRVVQVESLDSVREVTHEISTAELTIGSSLKSELLLLRQSSQNNLVFDMPQRVCVSAAPGFEQSSRPKKAADVIRSEFRVHPVIRLLQRCDRRCRQKIYHEQLPLASAAEFSFSTPSAPP
jgi:hypothetical protein